MNINEIYKVEEGYPLVKVYTQQQWYGIYTEIELSWDVILIDVEVFFKELSLSIENLMKGRKISFLPFRVLIGEVNEVFLQSFTPFAENLKRMETEYGSDIFFKIFVDSQNEVSELLENLGFKTQILPAPAFMIEKIEWYWNLMHDDCSPQIRYNPHNGEIFMFGRAYFSHESTKTHILTVVKWIQDFISKSQEMVTIIMTFSYEGIKESIQEFIEEFKKNFDKDKIMFIWYYDSFFREEEPPLQYKSLFEPYFLEVIEFDADSYYEAIRKAYEIYYKI